MRRPLANGSCVPSAARRAGHPGRRPRPGARSPRPGRGGCGPHKGSPGGDGGAWTSRRRTRRRGRRRRGRRRGPGRSRPLRPARPTSRAGRRAIHRATSSTANPRRRASVQTAGRASWSEAMPPQARAQVAASRGASARAGQGEWSEPMVSISPSRRPSHSASRLLAPADGRRALEPRVAVGDLLRGEREVMRAGLDGHRQPLARGAARASAGRRPRPGGRCGRGTPSRGRARSGGGSRRAPTPRGREAR